MKEKIEQLKKKVEAFFDEVTENAASEAMAKLSHEMDPAIKEVFDRVVLTIVAMIRMAFDGDSNVYAEPLMYDDLRTVLNYHPLALHDAWHLAETLTDEDFLACEKAIAARNLAGLERLRDPYRKQDYRMPLYGMFIDYLNMLIRLRYFFIVYAHRAKAIDARALALKFLRMASLIGRRVEAKMPYFTNEQIDDIIFALRDGFDEFLVAHDYALMPAWDVFCAREKPVFENVEKSVSENAEKSE